MNIIGREREKDILAKCLESKKTRVLGRVRSQMCKEDLLLIVCGSATSWIISNILNDKGGTRYIRNRKL